MRKELQEELNRINELYHQYDLELRKAGGDYFQRQKMRDMLNKKKQDVISSMGDDLQKLNIDESISTKKATITPKVKDIVGEGMEAGADILDFPTRNRAMNKVGKLIGRKTLGSIPVIGGIAQALMTGDASAAIPGLGDSESAGMSSSDENKMLAEIERKKQEYNKQMRSPASITTSNKSEEDFIVEDLIADPSKTPERMDDPRMEVYAKNKEEIDRKRNALDRLRLKQDR